MSSIKIHFWAWGIVLNGTWALDSVLSTDILRTRQFFCQLVTNLNHNLPIPILKKIRDIKSPTWEQIISCSPSTGVGVHLLLCAHATALLVGEMVLKELHRVQEARTRQLPHLCIFGVFEEIWLLVKGTDVRGGVVSLSLSCQLSNNNTETS